MNPRVPFTYEELGRWVENFAAAHARRVNPAIEVRVETDGDREGRRYDLRLGLGGRWQAPPLELDVADVTEGRARFAWCEELARTIRDEARRVVAAAREPRPA
jgi:hypothetical protein